MWPKAGLATMPGVNEHKILRPLLLLASLFFVWGFLTSMNDILIPHFKEVFELTHFTAMLVQFAFFGAYFVGSVAYLVISVKWSDPIARIGYQRGAVLGLMLSGLGTLLFLPASTFESYGLFLSGLFVLGLGFTLLQISANPYVTVLGPERTASARLNLCQGFNSLGTTLGPLVGGGLILEYVSDSGLSGTAAVRGPYTVFAALLFALAVFMALARMPRIVPPGTIQRGFGALRYPHTVRGILAIFLYVGAEVSVGSILISYLATDGMGAIPKERASVFVSIYWGGLMIGRFLGSVVLGNARGTSRLLALLGIPVAGFFFLVFTTSQARGAAFGETLSLFLPYSLLLVLNLLAFVLGASRAGRTTGIFALLAAALLTLPILTSGPLALWAVVGLGLFNSIMWSNIFSLAIEGLGERKSQASSLLVMAIVGGAILPPAQVALADTSGVPVSFVIPLVAYAYIAYYGFRGHRPAQVVHE